MVSSYDAGDSFISDDDEELCPLCVEEMDISDKNFKPCPCGYQVCQFCYNNIRQNPQLNGRCPACRRTYDDDSVEYRIISPEEWKKDHEKQARKERDRKQRQREKKESEQSSRKHLSGMRVIQKNLVYVIGLNPNIPTDELHHTLRTEQFFGQYGKIQKIVINRRNNANGNPGIGVYVTFARKEDAARCITAVDGSLNDGKYLRAAYGTTKYCSSYLRGQSCPNPNCMFLHEPGEEADSYTRQDLSTYQVAGTGTRQQSSSATSGGGGGGTSQSASSTTAQSTSSISQPGGGATRGLKIGSITKSTTINGHDSSDTSSSNNNSSSTSNSHSITSEPHNYHLPATVSWATKASPSTPQAKLHTASLASYPPLPIASSNSHDSASTISSTSTNHTTINSKNSSSSSNSTSPITSTATTSTTKSTGPAAASSTATTPANTTTSTTPATTTTTPTPTTTTTTTTTTIVPPSPEPVYEPCPEPKTPDVAVTYMHDSLIALANPENFDYCFSDDLQSAQNLTTCLPLFSFADDLNNNNKADGKDNNKSNKKAVEKQSFNFDEEFSSCLFKPSPISWSFRAKIDFSNMVPVSDDIQIQIQQQQQQQSQQQHQRAIQSYQLDLAKTSTPPPPGLYGGNNNLQQQQQQALNGNSPSINSFANLVSAAAAGGVNGTSVVNSPALGGGATPVLAMGTMAPPPMGMGGAPMGMNVNGLGGMGAAPGMVNMANLGMSMGMGGGAPMNMAGGPMMGQQQGAGSPATPGGSVSSAQSQNSQELLARIMKRDAKVVA